jgi:hypothetical protein
MKKIILGLAVVACSGLWAVAQTSTMPGGQTNAGQATSSASASSTPMTVDGCLAGAGGSYTLKDKATGVTYQLAGDTAKLAPHVGHELQLTGTTSYSSASASSGASPSASTGSASAQPTLNMSSGKMISSSCSAQ